MFYKQLTKVERNQIYVLLQGNVSKCRIATILRRDPSTISREISRNHGQRGYRPKQAESLAQERRKTPRNVNGYTTSLHDRNSDTREPWDRIQADTGALGWEKKGIPHSRIARLHPFTFLARNWAHWSHTYYI